MRRADRCGTESQAGSEQAVICWTHSPSSSSGHQSYASASELPNIHGKIYRTTALWNTLYQNKSQILEGKTYQYVVQYLLLLARWLIYDVMILDATDLAALGIFLTGWAHMGVSSRGLCRDITSL